MFICCSRNKPAKAPSGNPKFASALAFWFGLTLKIESEGLRITVRHIVLSRCFVPGLAYLFA